LVVFLEIATLHIPEKEFENYFSIVKIDSDILLHYSPTPIAKKNKFSACKNRVAKIELPKLHL